MDLVEAIFAFDGRSVDDLRIAVRSRAPFDEAKLIELCASEEALRRTASTWVVKALLEEARGDGLDLNAYFSRLGVETEWQALLHLLQSVQFAPALAKGKRDDIVSLVNHKKTLVAVWALDALVRIAKATGEGLAEARARVDGALNHDKSSMRARARHLSKLLGL